MARSSGLGPHCHVPSCLIYQKLFLLPLIFKWSTPRAGYSTEFWHWFFNTNCVLQFNSILTLTAWNEHQISQVERWGSPKDCPCFSCQSQLGSSGYPLLPLTCLQIQSFPYPFSFVHLLERLTKSRKALSCQLPFSYKGHEWTTRWGDVEGKVLKGPQHRCFCPCSHPQHIHKFTAAAAAKSLQSCPTLCDPMACSLPGSPVRGIFQARVLEWVAIAFSNKFTNQEDLSLSQPLLLQEWPSEVSRDSSLVWGLERDSGSSSSTAKKILGPIPVRPLPTKHSFPTLPPRRTQQNFLGDLSAARPDEQAEQMCCLISLDPGSKVRAQRSGAFEVEEQNC